jgi:2-methylaconitate cis-trans-isomerase PrpF
VGPYAIEESFVKAVEPVTKVRVHSRNTNQIFIAEVPVRDGKPLATGDYEIAAVPGKGAKIQIDMAATAGSRTGKALPTGKAVDTLDIPGFGALEATLLDLVNPCVFVRAVDVGMKGDEKPADVDENREFMELIDKIRIAAVERMGFSKGWAPQNPIPFVVFVSSPRDYTDHLTGKPIKASEVDLLARMIMLGKMHQAYAGSVSCVTGLAAVVPGSLVNQAASLKAGQTVIHIGHPAGVLEVEAEVETVGGEIRAKRVVYGRSVRRIMDGHVYVPHTVFE